MFLKIKINGKLNDPYRVGNVLIMRKSLKNGRRGTYNFFLFSGVWGLSGRMPSKIAMVDVNN